MVWGVGSPEVRGGSGQHDPRQAAVLVEGVQGQSGGAGQRRAVLKAVRMNVGSGSRCLWRCCVVPGVRPGSVGLQLRIMHEAGGNISLAGMSQGVLHRPLQLHPPVLEPVSDL